MAGEQAFRPIGWWLKEADTQLDRAFDRRLQDRQVDRRGWQVLAALARQPLHPADLVAALSSFDPAETVEAVVADVIARGWVESSGGLLQLTRAGRREQEVLAPLVDDVRSLVAAALPQEDYRTLVGLLERLVTALREDEDVPAGEA